MLFIFAVLFLGEFSAGIVLGILLTIARYQTAETRRQADEEELAELEELYAAWAALRAGVHQPPPGHCPEK
jgi:hypothetical protein